MDAALWSIMRPTTGAAVSLYIVLIFTGIACGGGKDQQECLEGDFVYCECPGEESGTRQCEADGTWGSCQCRQDNSEHSNTAPNSEDDTASNVDGVNDIEDHSAFDVHQRLNVSPETLPEEYP